MNHRRELVHSQAGACSAKEHVVESRRGQEPAESPETWWP